MAALAHPPPNAPSPGPGTKRRLDYIDALRGAACLWVLLFHTFSSLPAPDGPWRVPAGLFVRFCEIGWLGVSLFLVLSGFCLFYPLAARHELRDIRLNVATFARRRAWRILPPYYAALALLAAVEVVADHQRSGRWDWHAAFHGPTDVLLHLLMLHNLSSAAIDSVSPAFWSLALECQLYVVFPLLVWSAARFGLRSILGVTFLVAVAWQGLCFHQLGPSLSGSGQFVVHYYALPGRCFEFAAGMAAAALVARPRAGQSRRALLLLLVPLIPALFLVLKVYRFGPSGDQAWGVIFAAALVLLAGVPNARFERGPILRPFVRLGAVSYSVYLMHQPLISILSPHLMHLPQSLSGAFAAGLIRLPLLVGIGYLFHLAFERPFMPGRPRTERQAEVAAAVSPAP